MVQNSKKAHEILRHAKKSKRPRIMIDSTPKMPFFGGKMDETQEMGMHGPGQVSTQVEDG